MPLVPMVTPDGPKFRQRREDAGYKTQTALARKLRVSIAAVWKIERGQRTGERLMRRAAAQVGADLSDVIVAEVGEQAEDEAA